MDGPEHAYDCFTVQMQFIMLKWLSISVLRNKLLQRTTMKWLLLFSKMKELVNSPNPITYRYEETCDCVHFPVNPKCFVQ